MPKKACKGHKKPKKINKKPAKATIYKNSSVGQLVAALLCFVVPSLCGAS
jgi:hypothetical protein